MNPTIPIKNKYSLMGQVVTISAMLHRHCVRPDFLGVEWKSEPTAPRAGWVVGYSYRRNGVIKSYGGCWESGDIGPLYLKVESTVKCALVVFWPTRKPVEVPLDAISPGGTPDNRESSWTEKAKAMLREESKTFPRKNGRFCKYVRSEQNSQLKTKLAT